MDITAYGEKNLARNYEENDKKNCCGALPSRRERGKFENFWKMCFEQVKIWLLKKLIYDFWLIENQFRLIEIDRSSQKILKEISIDWKTDWINRNSGKTEFFLKKITWFLKKLLKALKIRSKMHENEMKCYSKTQFLNLVFPNLRFSNNLL